ncbi:hypothetical protein FGO68_gene16650 [Halteria grandinella]|uniref:Uncharacterized protein n=1 Tax=Halteria grandinella TaxID=5974 RepID=A0A8J8NN97_HALGN|nr:hypothetical protein FGO68_gene16650 [Halteria grandinella]
MTQTYSSCLLTASSLLCVYDGLSSSHTSHSTCPSSSRAFHVTFSSHICRLYGCLFQETQISCVPLLSGLWSGFFLVRQSYCYYASCEMLSSLSWPPCAPSSCASSPPSPSPPPPASPVESLSLQPLKPLYQSVHSRQSTSPSCATSPPCRGTLISLRSPSTARGPCSSSSARRPI